MRHIRKTAAAAGIIAAIALLLSGCVHMTAKLKINSDGSADWGVDIQLADAVTSFAQTAGTDIWGDLTKQMEANGFTVKASKDADYSGINASRHYKNVQEMEKNDPMSSGGALPGAKSSFSVQVQRGFFATTYAVDMKMDVSAAMKAVAAAGTLGAGDASGSDPSLSTQGITGMLLKQAKISFIAVLPAKAASSNASSVSADGLTHTWNLSLDKPNDMKLAASIPNTANILMAGAAALTIIAAVLLLLLLRVRARKHKKPAPIAPAKEIMYPGQRLLDEEAGSEPDAMMRSVANESIEQPSPEQSSDEK